MVHLIRILSLVIASRQRDWFAFNKYPNDHNDSVIKVGTLGIIREIYDSNPRQTNLRNKLK